MPRRLPGPAAAGEAQPDAELALRLGYFDQAHFVRDFQRMVGQPPAAYVRSQVAPG